MNKIKLASGVLLVFLVGVLTGSLGTGIYYKNRVAKFEQEGPPVQERIQIILGRFSNDLNLTNEQRVEIEKIVRESQEKKITLSKEMGPDLKQINDDTFTAIKKKLTDTQKTKLEELMKTMDNVQNRFPSGQRQQQRTPDQTGLQQQGAPQEGGVLQQQGMQQPGGQQGVRQQGMPQEGTPDVINQMKGGTPQDHSWNGNVRLEDELKVQLLLTPEQETKIKPVVDKYFKERQDIFSKYKQEKQDSQVIKSAIEEKEKAFDKEISALLTKEQITKYKKARESGTIKLSPPDTP